MARYSKATELTIPFQLHNLDGRVEISYGINQDPETWGFSLFGEKGVIGYPTCIAKVDIDGISYHGLMGWLQLISITKTGTQQTTTFIDTWPILSETDMPFAAFGYLPTLFNVPRPDPALHDQTWHADTFLVACPDIFLTRRISNVAAFCWGYRIEQKKPIISPIKPLSQAHWEHHLDFLRKHYPSWKFF